MDIRPIKLPTARPEPTTADYAEMKSVHARTAAKFNLLALLSLLAGFCVSGAVFAYFWVVEAVIFVWAFPVVLGGAAVGVAFLKLKWAAQREIEAADIMIRKLHRQNQ